MRSLRGWDPLDWFLLFELVLGLGIVATIVVLLVVKP